MGLLSFFRFEGSAPAALPKGSFTVDRTGAILTSTLPSGFRQESALEIAALVLKTFRSAREVNQITSELVFNFSGMKLTARELRGGAIIFLSPRELGAK